MIIDEEKPTSKEPEARASQETVLFPFLYIFTADIPKTVGTKLMLYAVDKGIIASSKSANLVSTKLQSRLN